MSLRSVILISPFIDLKKEHTKIQPFLKIKDSKNNKCTYEWDEAYQNLKHDKGNAIEKFGTIKSLFSVMAALYLLNIYYHYESSILKYVVQTVDLKEPFIKSNFLSILFIETMNINRQYIRKMIHHHLYLTSAL